MIRAATVLTALLAAGSGLYLYQAKHRTKLVDDQIRAVESEIQAARTRIGVLRAEWALENAPSRLADLASRYLTLQPMKPAQAVRMANLASRLPPRFAPGAAPVLPEGTTPPAPPLIASEPFLAVFASLDMLRRPVAFPPSGAPGQPSPALLASAAAAAARSDVNAAAPDVTLAALPQPAAPPTDSLKATAAVALATPPASVASLSARAPDGAAVDRPSATPMRGTSGSKLAPAVPLAVPQAGIHPTRMATAVHGAPAGPPVPAASPPRLAPVPVVATALGGAYPNLPPPTPLSGAH